MGLAADRSTARLWCSALASRAASLGLLIGVCAPGWAQQTVPAAEVISVEDVVSTEAGDGSAPIPTKPLRLNTGLVTIESDQQQADQQ
ncbi:MAG: hypothetical protein ACO3JW_07995, partial [Vulcanococcus sp.]